MAHVRSLRDRFAGGVVQGMKGWQNKFIPKNARFTDPNTLDLGDEQIRARSIVIAAGSKPFIPEIWKKYRRFFVDTDEFFELETLPQKMAVMGMGPIGLELGQALSRLGIDLVGSMRRKAMGEPHGRVHIYGSRDDGRLLGVEMIAPAGEHMAHLLAWAIAGGMRADQVLSMPFYHPVLEEALRTALRTIAKQAETPKSAFEFSRCDDEVAG